MTAVCLITACQFGVSHSKHIVVFWDFLEYKSFSKPKSSTQFQDFVPYVAPRTIVIFCAKKLKTRVKSLKHPGLKVKSHVERDPLLRL